MKWFEANGTVQEKKGTRKFSKTIEAESEKRAMEKLLSLMGSQHKLKRHKIRVMELKEAKQGK